MLNILKSCLRVKYVNDVTDVKLIIENAILIDAHEN